MKFLIISPKNRRLVKLTRWLHRRNEVVVATGLYKGIQILEELARLTPHFLLFAAEDVDSDTEAVLTYIEQQFETICLVRLPMVPGTNELPTVWSELLLAKLKKPKPYYVSQDYANESRLVFHAPEFDDFSQRHKLTSGGLPIDHQCSKLFLLLDGGLTNHGEAQRYLSAIEKSLPGLESEISYRVAHGSYKALSWSRDLAAKYVSVLVHYIPSIQREYLPCPGTLHKSIDYVSYHQQNEGHYALSALCQMHINPAISELLVSSAGWIFSGQGGVTLVAEQAQLLGLAQLLHQVSKAHIATMSRWLDPARLVGDELPREAHRQEGLLRDFWGLGLILDKRDMLEKLLTAYHTKSWRPDFVFPPLPTYSDFIDKYTTGRNV